MEIVSETRGSGISTPLRTPAPGSVKIDKINQKIIINDERILAGL